MKEQEIFTLINQQDGDLAFKLLTFNDNSYFDHLQRNNFYSIIWVKDGSGLLKADFSEYLFRENTLFAFSPYQPFMFSADKNISGVALQFHSDFYCIHRNPKETNCDATLFNNIYQAPFFQISKTDQEKFNTLLTQLKSECLIQENSNYELLIPFLKIFLTLASRIKEQSKFDSPKFSNNQIPFLLRGLKSQIENNFKEKHSASDYAALLNISPNALAKIVKANFNKTLTELITERIIIEAKRELYMTSNSIKEIARSLGYEDEFYFSRFFKAKAEVSPQQYRETVGFGRGEMTL